MMSDWKMLTNLPVAGTSHSSEVPVPFAVKTPTFPSTLPAEAYVPKPNLAAVLVEGMWVFESAVKKGWERPGPSERTLKCGQHIFLEYNRSDAKIWSGVPLPKLHLSKVPGDCVYAGVLHDDQARIRVSDDMTSIIVRVNGRVPPNPDTTPASIIVPVREVAKSVFNLEPAGYLNHFCYDDDDGTP